MAVNSFNPRLYSSSSSENDAADDVFRGKGASVAPVGGSLPTVKSRSFMDPVAHQTGKDGVKEESKTVKTAALSDSSNVLRRQRGRLMQNGNEGKSVCSTIEEGTTEGDKSSIDSVFPEPESIRREASRDSYRFSIVLGDEGTMDEAIRLLPTELENPEDTDQLDEGGIGMGGPEVFYMRDVAFGAGDMDADLQNEDLIEDLDDDSYPEREVYPAGYHSYLSKEPPYIPAPWDLPRTVLRSHSDLEMKKMPELPDDLIQDTAVYTGFTCDFTDLSPVPIPSAFTPPNCEERIKFIVGED